jgi:hypothetical protein
MIRQSIVQRQHHLALVAVFLSSLTIGCSVSSPYMHEQAPPQPIPASRDKATIVFLRPSSYGGRVKTTILDTRGRFLGEDWGSTYFAVQVEPGEHVFLAWAENTAALRARLAAGKTYYIEVAPKMGALSARMHLLALTPRSASWSKVPEWMSGSVQVVPDEAAGQAYLQARATDVDERIRRAKEALSKYSSEELAERTLRPEDGQ